ncbi:ferric-dicitrate binding protein FerR, regulates iron transport through sigma-19 [Parapedobacter composti]|uniref:Ferric-dicitrate binding protein FerR, regulates iron transport through sigma-19 n=1 Tax=Parapedobacter composti TaxID=623281 RepID=A0A1I1H5V0_9SPHI|nr:FecR family protein [Parapedobacter composti]SFC19324.1 ferric-dicitrate binding protein FerR, regulates iron transport through sigma-19 [Parapedobacter composti]
MDKSRIEYLHQRYLDSQLSAAEKAEWEQVLHAAAHEPTLQALMHGVWASIGPGNARAMPATRANRIFRQVIRQPRRRAPLRTWLQAAAVLLAVSGAVWFFWGRPPRPAETALAMQDIAPGRNQATLSLADGSTVALSERQTGIVVADGITYADGSAVVSEAPDSSRPTPQHAGTLTLATPKGGTYRVTLSDGTTVWLNAASTLTYPSRFYGSERRVTVEGEAYFAVAEDPQRPFIVASRHQELAVVGTEFNINAYPDENTITTTLVTGKVSVSLNGAATGQPAQLLTPGKQSILQQGRFSIQEVATDQYTAWRDGRFHFDGKTLPQVMRELSRWYNIKVAYEGRIPAIEFYGGIRRNHNLATVMSLLETNGIRYRLTPDTTLILSTATRNP